MSQAVKAQVRHVGRPKGTDLYEVDCEGYHLACRYPVNRMCKLLQMAGIDGTMVIVNSMGKVRMRVSIAKHAEHRIIETSEGFRKSTWDGRSLKPLLAALLRESDTQRASAKGRERRKRLSRQRRDAGATRAGRRAVPAKEEQQNGATKKATG